MGPSREEFKYCIEAPEEGSVLSCHLEKKGTFSSKVDVKVYCSILKVFNPAWLFRFWYGQEKGWNLPSSVTLLFEDQIHGTLLLSYCIRFLNYFWLQLGRKCCKIRNSCLSCDLVKIWCEGKFERLITKTNPDQRLAMILASKLLFLTDFGEKLDDQSSAMTLQWQHWITHETKFVFKMEAYK